MVMLSNGHRFRWTREWCRLTPGTKSSCLWASDRRTSSGTSAAASSPVRPAAARHHVARARCQAHPVPPGNAATMVATVLSNCGPDTTSGSRF